MARYSPRRAPRSSGVRTQARFRDTPAPMSPDRVTERCERTRARWRAAPLDSADEQPIRIWRLALPSGKVFAVFELVEARCIAGAVESADQRILGHRPSRARCCPR